MELLKLDQFRRANTLLQNYDSLIWTERFNNTGNFELITSMIEPYFQMLPYGSMVTLDETDVPMIVETHDIVRPKKGVPTLKITGRAFDSVLDRRVTIPSLTQTLSTSNWTMNGRRPSDVAATIMYLICETGVADVKDIFEPSIVQFIRPPDYMTSFDPIKPYDVPRGTLLSVVQGLLQTESTLEFESIPQYGLRSIRPNASGSVIAIEIYKGTDRRNTVLFEGYREMLDEGRYLFSKVGYSNVAYGVGDTFHAKSHKGNPEPSGLERRVMLVDVSASGFKEEALLTREMTAALSEARETSYFDGKIDEELIPYVFNRDYFLGDTVRMVGDYGLVEDARVTEYIRSIDRTGYKAFPTLETL